MGHGGKVGQAAQTAHKVPLHTAKLPHTQWVHRPRAISAHAGHTANGFTQHIDKTVESIETIVQHALTVSNASDALTWEKSPFNPHNFGLLREGWTAQADDVASQARKLQTEIHRAMNELSMEHQQR